MPLYMYQAAYASNSWAAQLKSPDNRMRNPARALCESAGGKLIGAWYCFGDYDAVFIADMPDNVSASTVSLAIAAGGACKALKTTVLMTGEEAVAAMKKTAAVTYKPAGR